MLEHLCGVGYKSEGGKKKVSKNHTPIYYIYSGVLSEEFSLVVVKEYKSQWKKKKKYSYCMF